MNWLAILLRILAMILMGMDEREAISLTATRLGISESEVRRHM